MKILIADSSKLTRSIIREELEAGGFEILEAQYPDTIFQKLDSENIDLLTLAVELPGESGFNICAKIVSGKYTSNTSNKRLPIVFITAKDNMDGRKKGFLAGAADFIVKPFPKGKILSTVKKLLIPNDKLQGFQALIQDDSIFDRKIIRDYLEGEGVIVHEAPNGLEGYKFLQHSHEQIDMVITDFLMPGLMGNEFCFKVRNELKLKDLPIIILSGLGGSISILELFQAGATDYIMKPFIKEELLARLSVHLEARLLRKELRTNIKELEKANTKLNLMANTDSLTNLANRRYFFKKFNDIHRHNMKSDKTISFIILDIDFFKKVNDTYGHNIGDLVLKTLAKQLMEVKSGAEVIARLGGEEFGILFQGKTSDEVFQVAEKIRKQIQKLTFIDSQQQKFSISISAGIYNCPPPYKDTPKEIYSKADEMLYIAKENGRNQVQRAK